MSGALNDGLRPPASGTACGESGRPAHSRDEDPFECHKRIRLRDELGRGLAGVATDES